MGPRASPSQQTLSNHSHKFLNTFKLFNTNLGFPTHSLSVFGEEDLSGLNVKGHGLDAAANPVTRVALRSKLATLGSAIVQPGDRIAQTQDLS